MSTDRFVLWCFDTVDWTLLPVNGIPEMTYYVLEGMLTLLDHFSTRDKFRNFKIWDC